MTVQIALSLLVLYAIRKKSVLIFVLAILAHTLIDAILPLVLPYGLWVTEAVIAAFAIASAVYIALSKRAFAKPDTPLDIPLGD